MATNSFMYYTCFDTVLILLQILKYILLDLLDLSVLLSYCVAFLTDLNVDKLLVTQNLDNHCYPYI